MTFRVLLVDDEGEFVSALAERLHLRGIDARIATSGSEALEKIATDQPQVIVLDVLMPGMGGLEVLQGIKKTHPRLPVILITGRGTWDGIQGIRLGAYDCLAKPLKIEELMQVMSHAVNYPRAIRGTGARNGRVKTFSHLVQEVQAPGRCHQCGGCVAFCAANYGALGLGDDGRPCYRDEEKCIACGICYSICPEISELDADTKKLVSWSDPMGRILGAAVARAKNPEVRLRATDGGVVTALLLDLFDRGRIDGAIVSRRVGPFQRQPWLARSREGILAAAGFHFDTVPNLAHFSEEYSTYSPSLMELKDVAKKAHNRLAFVGTPCQINALRRMEVLGVAPADAVHIHFGLFCAGNFQFGPAERRHLENLGNFHWNDVCKVNLKEELMIHLRQGDIRSIPLDQLTFMKRQACLFCGDFSAEYADISFGGLGAPPGWTTIMLRSAKGEECLASALRESVELVSYWDSPGLSHDLTAKVLEWSDQKKQDASKHLQEQERRAV
ncbi:MAG: Coenzyme F420 hydrogenase/dehydrogenase, beta subunit C-terminal domain [Desulfobaccales bacterium]